MHNKNNIDNIELHDFGDGNGPVPAHHHPLGGGWVADSAHADDTAYIGKDACVFGNAVIKDESLITDHAQVGGFAVIKDHACIRDHAAVAGTCVVQDNSVISGNSFINRHVTINGNRILERAQFWADNTDCLGCPALLDENYGATQNNPCLYCLKKMRNSKTNLTLLFRPACSPGDSVKAWAHK